MKRPPARQAEGVHKIAGGRIGPNGSSGATPAGVSPSDPRHLVAEATICELVAALAAESWHPFAFVAFDDGVQFICPRCRYADHNGGRACVVNDASWYCDHCRHSGTRYALEHRVLESARALAELVEMGGDR